MNTVSFISIPGSIAPDQEILVFGDRRLNYAQLNELVGRLSSSFKTLGLKPRDVIAALDTNSDNYIAGYYAAAKAGLTWLPLNYRAKDAELEYMINTAGAKVLLAGDRYLDLMARVSPKLKTAKVVAWGEGTAGMPRLADLIKAAEVDEGEVDVDDEDVSVLMYTSGTTSLPKGVMLRFRDFAAYVTANVEMADGSERGVALVCVPFYHIAGTTAMMTNLWTGRRMVVMAQFDPKSWLQLVEREKVTHAFVVPTMMKQLLDEPSFSKTDFSSLTNLAYGGAAMPIQTIRRAIEAFPKSVGFVNAYGQTETTSSLTVLGPDDHRIDGDPKTVELKLKRLNSIGRPLPDVEVAVRDDEGTLLAAGQVGEILIRTPRIMKGYAGREDDSRLPEGWRATGDLGWVDEEGYVFFAGRKDDMIIRGGENIYPREVEEFLYSHPDIADVQVIGVPSEKYGEEVMAWVKLREGAADTGDELAAWCKGKIATYKIPRHWKFVESFPMTFTGKVQKFKMREVAVEELGLEKAAGIRTA